MMKIPKKNQRNKLLNVDDIANRIQPIFQDKREILGLESNEFDSIQCDIQVF